MAQTDSTTLYHARRFEEDAKSSLHPTQADPQWRNGTFGQFLYATPRLDQAYLYAAPFPNSPNSFMTTLDGNNPQETLARFDSRPSETARSAQFSHRIYAFGSDGFAPVQSNPREWICDHAIDSIRTLATVTHIDQVLEKGIQYFCLAPGKKPDDFLAFDQAGRNGNLSREFLSDELAKPNSSIVWENERDGLGMDPQLAQMVASKRSLNATAANLHLPIKSLDEFSIKDKMLLRAQNTPTLPKAADRCKTKPAP